MAASIAPAVPIAVTMGEPAGIGGEITLKAWQRRAELPRFFTIDDPHRLRALAERLGVNVPIVEIDAPSETDRNFDSALPVLPIALQQTVEPGTLNRNNLSAVIDSIDRAVELVDRSEAKAIVTNPIHKAALNEVGFAHSGHTEYLGEKSGVEIPVMLLASPTLKVVPVTVHVSLTDALRYLTSEKIVRVARQAAASLRRDFGIQNPRLAVAGANPHAGEGGFLGIEEQTIIEPAINDLKAEGIDAFGPCAADSMFHEAARSTYDAAICMYHDQALIPLKTLSFDDGVNVTLGLPYVRTSPDHGTGLDIAGTGQARETSFVAALKLAAQIVGRRATEMSPPIG